MKIELVGKSPSLRCFRRQGGEPTRMIVELWKQRGQKSGRASSPRFLGLESTYVVYRAVDPLLLP